MSKKKKSKTAAKADANLAKVTGTEALLDPVTDKDSKTGSATSTSGIISEPELKSVSLGSIDPKLQVSDAKNNKTFTKKGEGNKSKTNRPGNPKNTNKGGNNSGASGKSDSKAGKDVAQDKGDVSSNSSELQLGKVISVRSNRTLTEYTKPEPFNLSILGFDSFTANLEWKLDEEIRKEVRNNVRSNFLGDNVKNLSVVKDLNKLQRKIIVHPVGVMKNGDSAYAAALYSPQARYIELDNSIVNIRQAHYNMEQHIGNAAGITTEGHRNSFWPWSSTQGNMRVKLPYLPSQIDDIKLFSLDGGAMLKSTNRLEATTPDRFWNSTNGTCYILPGIPGFNHYESNDDVANGNLVARHNDARLTVNRQYIYSGDRFTSTRHHSSEAPGWMNFTAPNTSEDVIFYRNTGTAGLFGAIDKAHIIGNVNEDYQTDQFAMYPDLQYAVMSNDFNKLYLKHIANITSNVDNPYKGQLAGLRDKQAFFNAVMSAIHFGTFFRCLLYALSKTYRNAAFVKAKLGALDYTNSFLHSMSNQKKEATLSFIKLVGDLIKFLPFNKFSVDNFKVWFDTSKNNPELDVFSESNPVYSIRALFCGMSNIMSYANQAHLTQAELAQYYIPRVQNATAIPTNGLDTFHVNQWGFYVKTLSTQVPIFVPHGDSLCNFFTYFDALFTARPIRQSHRAQINQSGLATAVNPQFTFTAMLDPLNYTAFAGNFFSFQDLNVEMSNWLRSYVELVTPFYDYIKSLNCSSSTVCFSDSVDFDIKDFFSNGLSIPDYKQHIISWFNQSPRLMLVNPLRRDSTISRFTTAIALVLGHRPLNNWVDSQVAGTINAHNQGNLLPRVGAQLALGDSYYDFGTSGDIMYNTATAWAVTAPSYRSLRATLAAATLAGLQVQAQMLDDGCFLDGTRITQPWDLYEYFWYPSLWNLPYYPQKHTQLVPGYDFSQQDAGITTANVDLNINGYYNGGNIVVNSIILDGGNAADIPRYISYSYFSAIRDAYVEEYYRFSNEALTEDAVASWSTYPEISCMRLSYGSTNRDLVWNWQWIAPNIPGWLGTSALVTRQNAISIFTGRNIGSVGLPTSYANVEFNPNNRQARLYRSELSKDFTESLGLPYLPFLLVSRGAALYLDQVYSYIPFFTHKILMTDLDLSEKFRNLTDVISKLHTGLYNGEAYPSSDGWGTDLLSHPDKQNNAKELDNVNK